MEKQILTVEEVANEMGVSPKSVRRLIQTGHLRRMRGFKTNWKISRVEMNRYLKEGVILG